MQKHHIMLTGFPETEKSLLIKIIKDLGGSYCYDQTDSEPNMYNVLEDSSPVPKYFVMSCRLLEFHLQKFLPVCTHVVAKKPCRSQKFLCACASGKWLVVDKYLLDSQSAKKFLPELKYEWGNIYKYDQLPVDVQQAPSRWRQALKKDKNKLPFSGWVVGLCVAKSFQVYKRH
uniref:SMC5-SMC6 complex localization factor protein 1-like n=1 Tax=Ciona intestinalis TaxID=7719 RepID=UPI000EF47E50|nr:SMC5-SMC6 complex localization factor protein 1-like [Ciona intestinalis]|eukprot:XP_026692586.1 SMC5-SMC6 complex localization factor protein 1-like [Ciona intestinalis]